MSHGIVFSWLPVSSRPWQNSECWKNFLMNLDGLAVRDTCRMSHQRGAGHSFSRRWCWQADKDAEKLVRNPSKAAHGDATGPQSWICDVSSIVSGTVSISWSSVVQDVRTLLFHSCFVFANISTLLHFAHWGSLACRRSLRPCKMQPSCCHLTRGTCGAVA